MPPKNKHNPIYIPLLTVILYSSCYSSIFNSPMVYILIGGFEPPVRLTRPLGISTTIFTYNSCHYRVAASVTISHSSLPIMLLFQGIIWERPNTSEFSHILVL